MQIKQVLLSILCCTISLSAFSQVDGNYNYSIGIRAMSLQQMPKIIDQTNAKDYITSYGNGALIKFNDNQISFRLSGNFYNKKISFNNLCDNCELAEGKTKDYSFKVGFEKSFNYSVVQPYFGTDLGFRANSFRGKVTNINNKSTASPYDLSTDKSGLIVSPVAGVKFNIIKQVTLFAESGIDFYYSYERRETIQNDANNTKNFAKYNKLELLVNAVSVGLQIHLVGTN